MNAIDDNPPDHWQAASARQKFGDVVDAAVAGRPQFISRRDGQEVVIVSRAYFEKTRPNLRTFLLTAGYADATEDVFDRAVREARAHLGDSFAPRDPGA